MDEVAQLVHHHGDDVQQAVLAAQRQDGGRVRQRHGSLHCRQTGAWTERPRVAILSLNWKLRQLSEVFDTKSNGWQEGFLVLKYEQQQQM